MSASRFLSLALTRSHPLSPALARSRSPSLSLSLSTSLQALLAAEELLQDGVYRYAEQIKPGSVSDADIASLDPPALMSELTQMLHHIALAYFESRAKELAALVPPNLLNITRKLLNRIFCCATVEGLLCEVVRRRMAAYVGRETRGYVDMDSLIEACATSVVEDCCVLARNGEGRACGMRVGDF